MKTQFVKEESRPRGATPMSTAGVSVDSLVRSDIERLGYATLADLLDTRAGISVTADGGLGKAATLRIRGEEGFRTRVLLDGIDIADPSSPQISPRVEHLLNEGLERVEILRGPQGLLYGADAGGIIALTTRKPTTGSQIDVTAETGSDGFRRLGGTLAAGTEQYAQVRAMHWPLMVLEVATILLLLKAFRTQDPSAAKTH